MKNDKKLIGYIEQECEKCGRLRVEEWHVNKSKEYICEKCLWNKTKQIYEENDI